MARLTLELRGDVLTADQQKKLWQLPEAKRRRMLYRVGQQIIKSSRGRLRKQQTVDGKAFEPRKDGRKERMLRRLGRALKARSTADAVTVTWSNTLTAQIAYRHQEGVPEEFDAKKMQKIHGAPNYDAPATKRQAKALRDLGYKIRRSGTKGWKKPSLKWIQENMKVGQAGVIIRNMRDKAAATKWTIDTPARPFLGVDDNDRKSIADFLLKELANESKARMSKGAAQ